MLILSDTYIFSSFNKKRFDIAESFLKLKILKGYKIDLADAPIFHQFKNGYNTFSNFYLVSSSLNSFLNQTKVIERIGRICFHRYKYLQFNTYRFDVLLIFCRFKSFYNFLLINTVLTRHFLLHLSTVYN